MILNLTDGTETVFLALILRAAMEGKPVEDVICHYAKSGKITNVLSKVQEFAKAKLYHPDLELVFEEIEDLMHPNDESRKEPKKK